MGLRQAKVYLYKFESNNITLNLTRSRNIILRLRGKNATAQLEVYKYTYIYTTYTGGVESQGQVLPQATFHPGALAIPCIYIFIYTYIYWDVKQGRAVDLSGDCQQRVRLSDVFIS